MAIDIDLGGPASRGRLVPHDWVRHASIHDSRRVARAGADGDR
jgi:hypothetical protein